MIRQFRPRSAWSTVLILFFLSSVAWMDRSVISMVIGPMKAHFRIGDAQVSLLAGFAFIVFYVLLLVPVGWLADRHSRKSILFVGVLTWSLGTFFCGIAGSYSLLFASRVLVGAGEGTVSPVAASVIGGTFGRAKLAAPMSVFSLGTSAGTAAGAVIAGYVLRWGQSQGDIRLPLLGHTEPWQLVFIVLGLPGLLAAFLAFAIVDPRTPAATTRARDTASPRSSRAFIGANRRTFGCIIFGFVLLNVAVTSLMTWSPEYLRRAFGMSPSRIGWAIGAVSLAAPLLCQAGVGFLVNRLAQRGMVDAPLRVMRWLLLPAWPLAILLWAAPTPAVYMTAMFLLAAILFPSNPLASTSVQMCAPESIRSELAAVHLAVLGIVGIGFGSSIVAFLSQYIVGENRLNVALGMVLIVTTFASWALLSAGLRPMRETVGRLRSATPAAGGLS